MKLRRSLRSTCCLLVAVILSGCAATIGTPNPALLQSMAAAGELGAEQTVRICGLLDKGVDETIAHRLVVEGWNTTEAKPLGLRVELVSLKPWEREGDNVDTIFRNVQKVPVAPECDRVLAFLAPPDDLVSHLAGGVSLIHGFVFATPESTRRFMLTPAEVVRHEFYHLMGCGHSSVMDECYRRIAQAKRERRGANAFFPVFLYVLEEDIRKNCGENVLIVNRGDANRIAQRWVAEKEERAVGQASPARKCRDAEGNAAQYQDAGVGVLRSDTARYGTVNRDSGVRHE